MKDIVINTPSAVPDTPQMSRNVRREPQPLRGSGFPNPDEVIVVLDVAEGTELPTERARSAS